MIRAIVRRIRRRYLRSRLGEDRRIQLHPGVFHGEDIFLTGDVNFGSEPFLVRLGSRITIADGVRFITHDGGARIFRAQYPDLHIYAPITVGDDCFIGMASIIMPGVTIGNGSVVGAGSIVTKDIPPGEVWAGVPARRIKSADEYRESLVAKSFSWPVGEYGEMWRQALMDLYPVETLGAQE